MKKKLYKGQAQAGDAPGEGWLALGRRYGKVAAVGLVNQGISSATNFALGFVLLRLLEPDRYGVYCIAFAAMMALAAIGNTLVLTPMVVHFPEKDERERRDYAGHMLALLVSYGGMGLLALAAAVTTAALAWPARVESGLWIAVGLATVAFSIKDFFNRHAYNLRQERWVFWGNLIIAAVLAASLLGFKLAQERLNLLAVFWCYALAQACSAGYGLWVSRMSFQAVRLRTMMACQREALSIGLWSMAGSAAYHVRTQAHIIIVAPVMGPQGVAGMNASKLLVTPPQILLPAMGQMLLPRLSSARVRDGRRMARLAVWASLAVVGCVAAYGALLLAAYGPVSRLVFGGKYQGLFMMTLLWCLYNLVMTARTGVDSYLQASKRFGLLTVVGVIGSAVVLALSYLAARHWGAEGVVAALAAGEGVVCLALVGWVSWRPRP